MGLLWLSRNVNSDKSLNRNKLFGLGVRVATDEDHSGASDGGARTLFPKSRRNNFKCNENEICPLVIC